MQKLNGISLAMHKCFLHRRISPSVLIHGTKMLSAYFSKNTLKELQYSFQWKIHANNVTPYSGYHSLIHQ